MLATIPGITHIYLDSGGSKDRLGSVLAETSSVWPCSPLALFRFIRLGDAMDGENAVTFTLPRVASNTSICRMLSVDRLRGNDYRTAIF